MPPLCHDYYLEGVTKALDTFLADKPESVIDLPTTQCMLIKQVADSWPDGGPHVGSVGPARA